MSSGDLWCVVVGAYVAFGLVELVHALCCVVGDVLFWVAGVHKLGIEVLLGWVCFVIASSS